ncbi:unnamed protein product [Brachionus calyciflorus]|uniref:Uncharacterized protein n=1 Tax=Brachionus calyciflorus TaxID=104777 RepID=A0A814M6W2_9BILA|nr:unnamed protein product [Brachionus calyciflorus]
MARIKRRTIANRNITKLRVNIKTPEVKINNADEMMSIPDHGIQTEVVKKDASTQKYDYDFSSRINIILKYLSSEAVSVYLILRFLNISVESSRDILTSLRMLNIQICHAWATTIIDERNLCVILRDDRGSYKRIPFYETFPEILTEAKSYAITEMCRKECTFDAMSLK